MKSRNVYWIIILFIGLTACSNKKNTFMSRTMHNLSARFNVYFNGMESFNEGLEKIDAVYKDNYTQILPVFKYDRPEDVMPASGEMDIAIKKAAKLITQHSITAKPKRDEDRDLTKKDEEFYNKPDYCNLVDDAYLLMGKGHFYRHDYEIGMKSFLLIITRFKNEETKYDAFIWLARTQIQLNKFSDAEEYLITVEKDKKHPKRVDAELNLVFADMFLKLKKYDDAIPRLLKAIYRLKKKPDIARYKFILAQIYQKQNNFKKASDLYTEVIKLNPPYELVFNSQVNRAACFDVGAKNGAQLKQQLLKMLKDDKNNDYQDQIYFALAQIALRENNKNEAIVYFKQSANKSISNRFQKAVSCLALADIYFAKPDYQLAGAYYDSAMANIDKKYPAYDELKTRTQNLKLIINNLKIISREDSLQKLAKMNENERNIVIDRIIQNIINEEDRIKQQNNPQFVNPFNDAPQKYDDKTVGKFYFYVPSMVSYGFTEFKKRWGTRKLEDNWRRSNKALVVDYQTNDDNSQKKEKVKENDLKKREYYLKDIPLTDSMMTISNNRIMEALFKLAEVYSSKMNDFQEAILTYETLNKRFPNHKLLLETYYQLYLLCNKLNRQDRAAYYKNEIIAKFPESKYAKIFTNPNYLDELLGKRNQVVELYDNTYIAYKQKDYLKVYANVEFALKEYASNDLIPRFLFLRALSEGEQGNVALMKQQLTEILAKYPDADIHPNVKDIINVIESGKYNADLYKMNPTAVHYYVLIVKKGVVDMNNLKFQITAFNVDFSNKQEFKLSDELLDNTNQLIVVKTLNDKGIALQYLQTISTKKMITDLKPQDYIQFVISRDNYELFLKDRQIDKYVKFYNLNYK